MGFIAKYTEDCCRERTATQWLIHGVDVTLHGAELSGDVDIVVRAQRIVLQGEIRVPGKAIDLACEVLSVLPDARIDVSGRDQGSAGGRVTIVARRLEGQLVVDANGQNGIKGAKGATGPDGQRGIDGKNGDLDTHHPHRWDGQPGGNGEAGGTGGKGGTGGEGGPGGLIEMSFLETPPQGSIRAHAQGGQGGDRGDPGDPGRPGDPGGGGLFLNCTYQPS